MATKTRKSIILPAAGLDVSKPGEWISERATAACQNIDIRRTQIQKRPGSIVLGTSMGERVQAIFDFDDGQATHFFRIGNTKAEKYNQATNAWASDLASPLTGSDPFRVSYGFPLLSGARVAVVTNGVDPILKNTGSGNFTALGGSPPLAKFLLDFGGYLLLAHVIDSGTTYFLRVQWCDTGDIESWTPGSGSDAGSVELLEDSDDITGIGRFGQYATVHKRNSIYIGYLTGTSSVFKFDRRATGAGSVANASIITLPTGEQAFLAADGIRLFNGVTAPTIESPVMDELREFMNPEHIQKSCATLVKELDEYWVGVPIGSQTNPETVYKFNYMSRQCYKDSRPLLVAMGTYRNTTESDWDSDPDAWDTDPTRWDDVTDLSLNQVVAFGFSDGDVTKRDTSANDDGVAVESFWVSKGYSSIRVIAKGQSVTVEYSIGNENGPWNSIDTFALESFYPADPARLKGYFDVVSELCFFKFSNVEVDETFTMKQFFVEASPREVR